MKWILCGKNDAAVRALELLLERGDEVRVLATAGDDRQDGWQRSLAAAAARLGARCGQPRRINAPAVATELAEFKADALISVQYDQILRAPLFRALGCPALNFHFSLLPRHRGVAPIAWAVLSGDAEAGVTLHHMVPEIDAGDVIAQRAVAIGPAETARDVYQKVSEAAFELFAECYPFSPETLATRILQDETQASYHRAGDFDFSRHATDWSQPARALQRWLCAMIFPPFQYPHTQLDGRRLSISGVRGTVGKPVATEPGTIVSWSPVEVEVAALDGTLGLTGLFDEQSPQTPPQEVLRQLRAGDRLR